MEVSKWPRGPISSSLSKKKKMSVWHTFSQTAAVFSLRPAGSEDDVQSTGYALLISVNVYKTQEKMSNVYIVRPQ